MLMNHKLMTLQEIKSEYTSEWVLIENPEVDENLNITKGYVIFHSKDRNEIYKKASDLKIQESAILYTGKLEKNSVVLL